MKRRLGQSAPSLNTPVILIGHDGRNHVVKAADGTARRLGIKVGMAAAQAQALIADLYYEDADPEGDYAALTRLAQWAVKHYSPVVSVDTPNGLLINATGTAHLFGGEDAMLTDILARLKAGGFSARVAIAPTYGAAHALSHHGMRSKLMVSDLNSEIELKKLPIAALRLPVGMVEDLLSLGFDTVDEVMAAPRAALALRFGSLIGQRIDQALGRLKEPINPVLIPDLISVEHIFGEPIGTPESLKHFIAELVTKLCPILESKALGARRLDLFFRRVDDKVEPICIGLAKPVRDIKRLTKLLSDKLDTIDPGLGVEVMTLSAPWIEPLSATQQANVLGEKIKPDVAGLVDTLSSRLGSKQLYQIVPVESDVPERSFTTLPPLSVAPKVIAWPTRWPRPARLLTRPEPIDTIALLPDNPPVSFTWKGVRRKVQRADGPERLFGEWWKYDAESEAVRDYFQVEDEKGERYWLFREGDGRQPNTGSHRWYMHGIFA